MEWTPDGSDQDVEDRRGESGGGGFGGWGARGLGLGGLLIVGLLSLLTGRNLFHFFGGGNPAPQQAGRPHQPVQEGAAEKRSADFAKFVLHDVQSAGTNKQALPPRDAGAVPR
jgi:predicted metalloprotease